MAKEYTELQLKAKEAGVKGWHLKLAETLEKELAELGDVVEEVAEEVVEAIEETTEEDPTALMEVMVEMGLNWDGAMMNLKALANKGAMWPFKELVKAGYEKDLAKKKAKAEEMAKKR